MRLPLAIGAILKCGNLQTQAGFRASWFEVDADYRLCAIELGIPSLSIHLSQITGSKMAAGIMLTTLVLIGKPGDDLLFSEDEFTNRIGRQMTKNRMKTST